MRYKKSKIYDAGGNLAVQWYIYFSFKNPDTGEWERFKKYASKRKLRMERYDELKGLKKKYDEMLEGGYSPFESQSRQNIRMIEAMEMLMNIRQSRTTKKKTKQTENYVTKKFIQFLTTKNLAKIRLCEFTKHHAQQYFDYLLTEERLGNRTCNNHLAFIKTYFNEFVNRDYLVSNVFSKIKKLQEEEASVIALTAEQMEKIKKHLPAYDKQLWLFISFIYYAFMRTVEITRLKRKHIDFEHDVILIDGLVSKTKRQQPVRIPKNLRELMIEHEIDKLRMDYYIFGSCMRPGLKYTGPTGVQKRWRKFVNTHGMKGLHMYWLKHTANGHALDKGMSVKEIQDHNRHHSLDQTMQYLNRFRKMAGDKINLLDGL